MTISSENSSADIAYFPRNCFFASDRDGAIWPSSVSRELETRSSLSGISLLNVQTGRCEAYKRNFSVMT
jgi:hypothetical protein